MIDRGIGTQSAFLIAAYVVLTAWNLNIQTIASPDEPRYAAPAREMLAGGDWIVPKFNHQPRLLKPILFYWVIAATGAAGSAIGLTLTTAMRIGPLLMGLLTVWGVYLLGARLVGARVGFIAAFVLMTAHRFHETSRELVVDMTLTAFLLWAWVFAHIALQRIERKKPAVWPLLGLYIALGLACLTKGPPLVALFFVVPFVVYLIWTRQLESLKHAGIWWGAPIALVLGCWWIFAVQNRGYDIWSVYKTENFSRAVGNKDHQDKIPFWFYIKNLGESFLPWVIVIPFVAAWSGTCFSWITSRDSADADGRNNAKYLACALGIPFFVLGIIISKRALYLVPLYPFIALWIAWATERAFLSKEGTRVPAAWSTGMATFAVLIAVCSGVPWSLASIFTTWGFEKEEMALLSLIGCAVAFLFYLASRSARRGLRNHAVLQILAVAWALSIGYEIVVRPIRERAVDSVNFYASLNSKLAGRPMVIFGESVNEAIWFLNRQEKDARVDFVTRPTLKEKFFNAPGTLLLAKESELKLTPGLEESIYMDPKTTEPRLKRGRDWFVLAVPNPAHPPDESIFRAKSKHAENTVITED